MDYIKRLIGGERNRGEYKNDELGITVKQIIESSERGSLRGLSGHEYEGLSVYISAARREKGLTVAKLAEQSDVTIEEIIDVELGKVFLSEAISIIEKTKLPLSLDEKQYRQTLLLNISKK